MGTTMSFYLIENRDFAPDVLAVKMRSFREIYGRDHPQDERLSSYFELFSKLPPKFLSAFGMSQDEMKQLSEKIRREEEKTDELGKVIPFPGTTLPEEREAPRKKGPALAYRPDAKWLPLFAESLCEGRIASSRDAAKLAKTFGVPVLAFSIFDSDVLFVSYADPGRRILEDYAKPNVEGFEEYDGDQYQQEFPRFLCAYGEETTLREAWEGEEVFADDRMAKLCEAIDAQLLYDADELPEGFRWIE